GSNGAGKSTTLRAISGIQPIESGSITFLGKDITNASPVNIVSLGISQVPEGRRLFLDMSVYENLQMGSFLRKDKPEVKKDIEEIYETFPILKSRKNQMAGTLSGGEQQMLAMARSLMNRPKLLLLDEPSMGLSPVLVEEVFKLIQKINLRKTTILLVEQNANLALSIAKRGYILEHGSLILEGKAEELLDNDDVKKAYLGG
ncbi:MAG: ABC transporter ATP-binding protein, partial [Oscillospiraceae bacterium]|nr:ABC transporter ATP-binding protein [Oscillospiraceae bacterium]